MKRIKVLGLLTAMALTFMAGCGSEPAAEAPSSSNSTRETREVDDDIEGEDWITWADYTVVEWHTPDFEEDLYITDYNEETLLVIHDYEEYTVMCELDLGGLVDYNYIMDSLCTYDVDEDGYEDLLCSDRNGDYYFDYVFVYYPSLDEFILDEDLSNLEGYIPGEEVELTAYEEAYGELIASVAEDNDFCNYYLFNINDEYDDVYELIIETGADREFEVYTVGLDDTYGFYPSFLGNLRTSADYAYVTMDEYDGDNYDGYLTLNVCVQGVRYLYAYTLDDDYNLCEELVYDVEEPDDYEIDGALLDRYSVTDLSPLATIDIQY